MLLVLNAVAPFGSAFAQLEGGDFSEMPIPGGTDIMSGTEGFEIPPWHWRQVLSTPRIGGRLVTVTVDPEDARRVFIGTGEGQLLVSEDAGVTWEERDISPDVISDRNLTLQAPGLPELGATTPSTLQIFFDPPFMKFIDRVFVAGVELVQFSTLPANMVVGFVSPNVGLSQDLLYLSQRDRRREITPVRRIAICHGAEFEVMVATQGALWGSFDGGRTFVRLFAAPGVRMVNVICSQENPKLIYLATTFGLFRSEDGGLTFDQVLVGWPGAPTTAVAFGKAEKEGDKEALFAAWGDALFSGDPDSDKGLQMIYPDFKNSDTAPWADIRWIDVTSSGAVWMATDDGVRVSHDGGKNWAAEARSLFERSPIRQVVVGPNDSGGERVAVFVRQWVYASDDGGKRWFPFFHGMDVRSYKHMTATRAAPGITPGWWLITNGGVWTTVKPTAVDKANVREEDVRWARERIAHSPSMEYTIREVLERTQMSEERNKAFTGSARERNRWPVFSFQFEWNSRNDRLFATQVGGVDTFRQELFSRPTYTLFTQAIWTFAGFGYSDEELGGFQSQFHNIKNQIYFIAQDSWHERMVLLQRIASGEIAHDQVELLKMRIDALEAVLETWLRKSMDQAKEDERKQKAKEARNAGR